MDYSVIHDDDFDTEYGDDIALMLEKKNIFSYRYLNLYQ